MENKESEAAFILMVKAISSDHTFEEKFKNSTYHQRKELLYSLSDIPGKKVDPVLTIVKEWHETASHKRCENCTFPGCIQKHRGFCSAHLEWKRKDYVCSLWESDVFIKRFTSVLFNVWNTLGFRDPHKDEDFREIYKATRKSIDDFFM